MSDSQIILLLAIIYISVGIGSITSKKSFKKMIEDFAENTGLGFVSGMIATALGYLIVINHNIWSMELSVIVTFIGWAMLLKGIMLLMMPNWYSQIIKRFTKNKTMMKIIPIICTFIGIFMLYVWYLMR